MMIKERKQSNMFNNRSINKPHRMHRSTLLILIAVLFSLSIGALLNHSQPQIAAAAGTVVPAAETQPMPHAGDSADDPAIWVHPSNTAESTIIGTDKLGGIGVYTLAGQQIQYLADGEMNNVDLRYNLPVAGQYVTVVAATNRTNNSIALYTVNPATRTLENIAARTITPGLVAYGACMYRSPQSGKYYVYVTSDTGAVEQWELFGTSAGKVDARFVRKFRLTSATEGCVADDELAQLYLGEENVGIWRYGAEPTADPAARVQVDSVSSGTGLSSDIEGLTLYYTSARAGYLMVSSQGTNSFLVYQREGNNSYLDTFVISRNYEKSIDAVQGTDGIDVTNVNLGSAFPHGVFVAQDNGNDNNHNQNFKLVSWTTIANAFDPDLAMDTTWDPRKVGAPGPSPTPSPSPSPSPPPGNTLRFAPVADARIEQANADTNFGASDTLRTDGSSTSGMRSYLRFNVACVTQSIQSAKLRVYATTSTTNGPGVYTTSNSWSENTITWNTRPAYDPTALDDQGAVTANAWIEYDVSAVVKGNGAYSFVLAGSSTDGLSLSSREGSEKPQLVLTMRAASFCRTFIPITR